MGEVVSTPPSPNPSARALGIASAPGKLDRRYPDFYPASGVNPCWKTLPAHLDLFALVEGGDIFSPYGGNYQKLTG